MSCVNINSREFKTLLDEVNISSSALELIIHKIQNSENSDRFPSAEEVNNLLKPKSFTGDYNMIEVWEKQYSSPINFPTLTLANEEYNNAVKIFGKDSISIVERKNGTYDLIVGNPTFESEYKYILSNAKRDSEGNLLAPNGKKSNLNERQYAQVRTKAFKEWFGDWEANVPIKELPTEYAYRFTDINELNDVLEYGDFRSIPEEKTVEGSENAIKSKTGRSFSIGKVYGNSHGGKGFAAGVNWKESGGTVTTGTAQKVIIGIPGKNTLWQVGHHGKYSTATDFNNIEKGKPLFIKFDENGDANIPLDGMKVYIQREDGMYVPYNTNNNVSKVVDENGEPLVVWHGGRKPTIFDTSGKQSGGAGIQKGIKGSYFITTKEQARHYANIAEYKQGDILFELSQQLQREVESGEITEEEANTIWNKNQIGVTSYFLNIRNPKINEYKYNVIDSKIDKDGHIFRKESREVEELSSVTPIDFDGQNIRIYHPKYESFAYPINGYKTYKQKDEIEWVATNPNQIKSAESNIGTFSTTDNNTRHSSITEQPIKVPSVTSFAERLQVQQQPKFASLVARGEISTSCR